MPELSPKIHFFDEEKIKKINPETLALLKKYQRGMGLKGLSQKTIDGYKNDIQHLLIYTLDNYNNVCITALTEKELTDFYIYCQNEGNNSNRMRRRMSSVSAFYKYLKKKKVIRESPMDFVERPKKV